MHQETAALRDFSPLDVRCGSKADEAKADEATLRGYVRFPPKADKAQTCWHVRFVPKADIRIAAKSTAIRSPRRRPLVVSERSISLDESGSRMRNVDRHHECAGSRDLA